MEEHKKNRTYIFDRPIIILGIISAGMYYFYGKPLEQHVMSILIFILAFNFWFIINRLQSSARIVAYIQLFLEGELKDFWCGWENALRKYRIWYNIHREEGDIKDIVWENVEPNAVPTSVSFYHAIWILHIIIVLSILVISLDKISFTLSLMPTLNIIITIIASLLFLLYALSKYRPSRLTPAFEVQRAIWLCVFKIDLSNKVTLPMG